jgi:diaminopimelate epimerase
MKVFKYEATGNDFILTKEIPSNSKAFAKAVCHRNFGIGADGILYPSKSSVADVQMNYYNSDGSIAKMCGNGIRAFARFLVDMKIIDKTIFDIETLAGIKTVEIIGDQIKVHIGKPDLCVGMPDLKNTMDVNIAYNFNGISGYVLAVGTLHTVVYFKENQGIDILKVGPNIQNNALFNDQTNVNFIEVTGDNQLKVQTFERGAGWTLSCGTGVSASVYHAVMKGYVKQDKIYVDVPGGKLEVEVEGTNIYLIGPAKPIMEGIFYETA